MEFYSLVVAGHLSFYDLRFRERSSEGYTPTRGESTPSMPNNHESVARICSEKGRGGKWERRTFRALLSYCGASFFGWQRQPGLLTVQGVLEKALGRFVDGKRARALSEEGKDPEANISVAGRTDKGVHAVGQVCSFYTWMRDIQPWEIEVAINAIEPHKLRALHVEEVCRTFHPNFSAKWRRYVYLLPLSDDEAEDYITGDDGVLAEEKKINVERANRMLCKLEGHNLSYAVFARDTQSSRSRGTATMCTIFHARANVAELPLLKQNRTKRAHVVCVEIVADRFLRKMVRVLVATAIREAAAGAADTALIMMTQSTCRRDSAPPAPALGLCLAEVGYEDMKEAQFLIH
ncbi:hypothetical protein O6H91_04G088800 [Diphasiastrum complanatum]|uniref:Uncharacterized protein n=1 Tax=Diphasiastrum complanatum TaxID=34168 RepID=A0ACC2DZ25_DIPCM|nr:hypothetical protein O6H91_04G088800 [Diphasiastrum complanatum]